jgi:tetratricopeptide (TPR) repeat protein
MLRCRCRCNRAIFPYWRAVTDWWLAPSLPARPRTDSCLAPLSRATPMGTMPSAHWKTVQDAFWAALECESHAREAFLVEHCAGDVGLVTEVRSLLEAHERAGEFLDCTAPSAAGARPVGAGGIRQLFQQAADIDSEDRTAWLDAATAEDVSLRREVAALLHVYERGVELSPGRDPPSGPDPFLGRTISHYEVVEKIGQGGMGVVYRARDARLDRVVALKFPAPRMAGDADAKARVLREARAASALDHVNICTIHEIGETDDGQVFIAMACYAGETLDQKLARARLPLDDVLTYAIAIAEGLAKAHEQGIAHRDIKPANVMVTEDAVVKLLDFGLAETVDARLAEAGAARATPAYMSPEQARGERVDHRSDLWSLGVVLYEMLTGRHPFKGGNAQALIHGILNDDPEPMTARRPDVPALLERVVARAMSRDVAGRYRDAGELLRDLRQVMDDRAAATQRAGGASAAEPASPLEPAGELLPGGERLQVTAVVWLFGEQDSSTVQRGAQNLPDIQEYARQHAKEVVHAHGGIIQRIAAGKIIALFGVPNPGEDDCVQAARAALTLSVRLRERAAVDGSEIAVRSGLDTGVVLARRSRRAGHAGRVTGNPLGIAARLARHARPGEVLATPASRRLLERYFETEDGAPIRANGADVDMTPARIGAETGMGNRLAAAGADLNAFTGRDKEREALRRGLQLASGGNGQFVTVSGEAGLGKSRLLHEFRRTLDGVTVLQGHCSSRGGRQSFQPFIEALQDHFRIGDGASGGAVADRVIERIREVAPELEEYAPVYLHLLSVSDDAHPLPAYLEGESLNRILLKALAALFTLSARQNPMVLLLEDWHWSDDGSRKALDQLVELTPSYPLLVVLTFRPDYSPAASASVHQTTIRLHPLEEDASRRIMESALGAEHIPGAVCALLHQHSGGNPFFLEEICRTLRDEGALRIDNGHLVLIRSLSRLPMPDTVQAVIRTRMHRLHRRARSVLRAAAVVGRDFTRGLLRHTVWAEIGSDSALDTSLDELCKAGLIHQTNVLPDATYRFRHVLTREVAYDGLLHHQRRRMHGLVGQAIEEHFADRVAEHAEVLAHHFGEARSWRKVVRYSRLAAERSYRLGQLSETLGLFEQARKALDYLPHDMEWQQTLVELLLRRERVYEAIAGHEEQQAAIDELFAVLGRDGDARTLAEVYIRQGDLLILQGQYEQAEAAIEEALQLSRAQAHGPVEQKALRCMGFLRWHQDRHDEAVSINEELVGLDRQRGDTAALATDLLNLLTVLRRLKEFDRGRGCVEELLLLNEQLTDPVRQLPLYSNIGEFYRDLGDHTRALFHVDRAIALVEQNPYLGSQTHQLTIRAQILLEQGALEESSQCYREAIGMHRSGRSMIGAVGPAQDERMGLARLLRKLADILVALRREEEAITCLEEAVSIVSRSGDPQTEALLRRKMAAVYEEQGRVAAAHAAWEQVRTLCHRTASVAGECEALEGLGRMARRRKDVEAALSCYREALRLAEQAGDDARQGDLRNTLGILAWQRRDYAEALTHYEQGLRIFEARDDSTHAGLMLNSIGATLQKLGRPEEAIRRLDEAIRLHRQTEQRQLEAHAHTVLGDVYFGMDLHAEALPCYAASLRLRPGLADRRGEGWMLHRLARVYAAQGRGESSRNNAAQAMVIAAEVGDEDLSEACRSFTGVEES